MNKKKNKEYIIQGKVFKFGNDVDTDQIIPARYLDTSDPQKLASHCMGGSDENFASKVSKGDVIVAGKNFGCGSSREHAPLSIKGCGISAVIAESFARIFFRNAVNIGLPIIEVKDFDASPDDELMIDLKKGEIKNLNSGRKYSFQAFPVFLQDIISAGGLMEKIREEIKNR
ncbi:MAG: 3-isopropylmalate dehydratase small subunit [Elusimicrobiota bacterium]